MPFLRHLKRWMVSAAQLVLHFAHGGLVATGLMVAAYVAFGISQHGLQGPWFGEALTSASASESPEAADAAFETPPAAAQPVILSAQMHRVADYLARKYKVSSAGVEPLVSAADAAGRRVGLDPWLIVAVMAVESSFNPIAESPMGAQGLMQVIPRFHQEKIVEHGESASLLDPATNIMVGAQALKEYVARTGSIEAALQVYNGAANDASALYANRVMLEKQRIEAAAHQRPMPMQAAAPATPPAPSLSPTAASDSNLKASVPAGPLARAAVTMNDHPVVD